MLGPRLGELAVAAGVVDAGKVDLLLRSQRAQRASGQFVGLGELLGELRVPRPRVRALLRQQGLEVVACELCGTRYAALGGPTTRPCLRCGRRLAPAPEDAPLSTEDAVAEPGPRGDALLAAHRARRPTHGRFVVLGEVGRGAVGVVYKAVDAQGGPALALKFLQRPADALEEDLRRFRREARAIAALRHEAIIACHGLEETEQALCLVMEFVPGVSLDVLLARRVHTPFQVVATCAKVARALHAAHEAGIVHRDVKPANVVIAVTGRPYLVDFGIAKSRTESVSLTMEGEVVGSVAYMAPEYLTLGVSAVSPRCDVYGLGVVLYEASTGQHPYGDLADAGLVDRIVNGAPTPVAGKNPQVPPDLARIIDRAVAKAPQARHPTAAALADELEAFLAKSRARIVGGPDGQTSAPPGA